MVVQLRVVHGTCKLISWEVGFLPGHCNLTPTFRRSCFIRICVHLLFSIKQAPHTPHTPTYRCVHYSLPGDAVPTGRPSVLPGTTAGTEPQKGSRPPLAQATAQLHWCRDCFGGCHSLHLSLLQRHHSLGHLLFLQLVPISAALGQVFRAQRSEE